MARHRRRRFRGYVSVPSFTGIVKDLNPMGKHVASNDVFVGAGAGLVLGSGVKYLLNKANVAANNAIPLTIMNYAGPISTFLAGVALYWFQRKSKRSRAEGHLIGATLAAIGPLFVNALREYGPKLPGTDTPMFGDYVMVPYGSMGLLTQDTGLGLYTADQYSGAEEWDPMSTP